MMFLGELINEGRCIFKWKDFNPKDQGLDMFWGEKIMFSMDFGIVFYICSKKKFDGLEVLERFQLISQKMVD